MLCCGAASALDQNMRELAANHNVKISHPLLEKCGKGLPSSRDFSELSECLGVKRLSRAICYLWNNPSFVGVIEGQPAPSTSAFVVKTLLSIFLTFPVLMLEGHPSILRLLTSYQFWLLLLSIQPHIAV